MCGFEKLKSEIVDRGLCTGCGTCAGVCDSKAIKMEYVDMEPLPILKGNCIECGLCVRVCPGKDIPLLELERYIYGEQRNFTQPDIGIYKRLGVGYALNKSIREKGSSGGLVTAILDYALRENLIDAAIVAGFNEEDPLRTKAKIARNSDELMNASQSKYAIVPINQLLLEATSDGQRIGIVGLPCHIHALRKLEMSGLRPNLSKSLKYIFGLFCASQFYFEGTRHVLMELGNIANVERVGKLEYRGGGWPGHMIATDEFGEERIIDRHQYMYHMLLPGYKRDRCEMCIDWSSELSDISFGDYWLPGNKGEGGSTLFIARTIEGVKLLEQCKKAGVAHIEEIDEKEKDSLASSIGYEMKKHSAAYRLKQRQFFGWPTPNYDYVPDSKPFFRGFHFAPENKK